MQMDINQILGYITALFIGITLGIFGGGGSILTLPVLVYLIGTESTLGIVYSMLIVGVTTFVGAINAYLKKTLNLKAAYSFGIPSVIAVFLTRKFITPWIEEGVWMIGSYELLGKHLLMILFALLMIIVALFMIFKKNKEEEMPTGDAQTATGTRHKKISLLQCGATADPAGSWSEHCRPRSGGPPDD